MTDKSGINLDDLPADVIEGAFASGGYPYKKRMKRARYERELRALQIELLKMQDWARASGARLVVVFEGRDAAGKGGSISRFMQHLNPRHARAVALSKPTDTERGQWYFQRYIAHLPTAGDITLFDRSWYNRAGVERVMGFCTEQQVARFFREVPDFEHSLTRDGIHLFKIFLTIGREQQLTRFHRRRGDPLRHWKLSPIDYAAIGKWDDYTKARNDMLGHTHTDCAPWHVIRANDKRRARLNCLRVVLAALDYTDKDAAVVAAPDDKIVHHGIDEIT